MELPGRRALIVDDNATNRLILMRQIEPWGMSGRETASGAEALALLGQGEPFDVAILDVRMPGMDGLTLATEIRKLHPALPLVILTSMGRREPETRDLGVAAFLTKPIKPAQLYRVLTGVLRGQRTEAPPPTSAPQIDAGMAQRHPLRILLAEDNIVNQKVAVRILERLGYRTDVVANGLEVLEALERQVYDVVLMDVQMPEMDGLEASRQIVSRWPAEQRPRLIAMTAYALEGDRERCIAAGMDDYISKPVRVEELAESLGRSQVVGRGQRVAPSGDAAQELVPRVSSSTDAIDSAVLDSLRAVLHKDVGEVTGVFLDSGAKLLDDLRQALAREDIKGVERAAHTLKSSSATFGAIRLSALCRELEVMSRQGELDGAADKVRRIELEFERAKAALQSALTLPQ
jgi:CheY-like chemotaxis protein